MMNSDLDFYRLELKLKEDKQKIEMLQQLYETTCFHDKLDCFIFSGFDNETPLYMDEYYLDYPNTTIIYYIHTKENLRAMVKQIFNKFNKRLESVKLIKFAKIHRYVDYYSQDNTFSIRENIPLVRIPWINLKLYFMNKSKYESNNFDANLKNYLSHFKSLDDLKYKMYFDLELKEDQEYDTEYFALHWLEGDFSQLYFKYIENTIYKNKQI